MQLFMRIYINTKEKQVKIMSDRNNINGAGVEIKAAQGGADTGGAKLSDMKKEMVDGVQVKTYTLNDSGRSLFNVPTEAQIEQDIQDYEKRMQEEADAKFKELHGNSADLNDADVKTLDKELGISRAEDSVKLDPEQIAERMKQIVKDDRIVCIGDSITYGHQVEGSLTWIGRLRREEEINLLNVGLDGDTTEGMLTRFKEHVLDLEPKAVLIMGGGNDIFGETPLEYVTNNIATMAQIALDKGIVPMVGIEPEPNHKKVPKEWKAFIDYDKACENMATLKQWLLTFAQANQLPVIDFDTGMKTRLKAGYGRYFMDGAHPNPAGHKIMAAVAKEAFIKMGLLQEKPQPVDDRFAL